MNDAEMLAARAELVCKKHEILSRLTRVNAKASKTSLLSQEDRNTRNQLISSLSKVDAELAALKATHKTKRKENEPDAFLKEFYQVCKRNLSEPLFVEMFKITCNRMNFLYDNGPFESK